MLITRSFSLVALLLAIGSIARAGENLVPDPSFEQPMPKNQFGHIFQKWAGWIYEGECEFRVSDLPHSGKHSLLIVGRTAPKIRAASAGFAIEPGRYRVTAWLRGLDIGTRDGASTELMFDGKYIQLRKSGTFGWSKLTYVADVAAKEQAQYPSFGLFAPGYLWIDDVSVERVGNDVPLTAHPQIEPEQSPIVPPGEMGANAVRCSECGYRNPSTSVQCYACGTLLDAPTVATAGPAAKTITSFEDRTKLDGGKLVDDHITEGHHALLVENGYAVLSGPQDWSGYDYLKADVFTDAKSPLELCVEVQDQQTRDYWTRVNYTTVVPPGASTLIIPTALYVGEKSRPGRPLDRGHITKLVFSIGEHPPAPLYIDNLRLERDTETARVRFDGLWAFDVGPAGSPLMDGFTPLDFSKTYTAGRGYGWKNARLWRAFDVLQPDPLYQDFLCIEQGGLAIDVPNGSYYVEVNMDSPSGFWGEVQRYRQRALILEGQRYNDSMDLATFKARYYRNFDRDDLPSECTFEIYQIPYFHEKQHAVEVRDGQLNIEFEGSDWACCVSSIIVYPESKAEEGRKFLDFVRDRRRFHFDNAFKRVLPPLTGESVTPTDDEGARGFIAFSRDPMNDVSVSDRPLAGERLTELRASAFAGEYEPVTVSVLPLRDLGQVTISITDLKGPAGAKINTAAIDIGCVQQRLSRVTAEGSVYTIAPRWIMPRSTAAVPEGLTRTFWLTVKTPSDASPGEYHGTLNIKAERGGIVSLPLHFTIRKGTLDAVDLPAGPFSHTIDLPWYDEEAAEHNRAMASRSLAKMREYGFTTASGLPIVRYLGFADKAPQFDFSLADVQMERFKQEGFHMPVVTYCPLPGVDLYHRDEAAMKAAGFSDYSEFIKAIFTAIQAHAEEAKWLPVYWNIGDEPLGDELTRSSENAEAYRRAFPKGPPHFTIPSSFVGSNAADPHFRLAKAVHTVAWNLHDAASVDLLHKAGGEWAFYNGGDRWTYGVYMYKAAKQYGMKYRLSWHWNAVAGDPYYPLDCREDDYAWCNSGPNGELVPSVQFERLREGLDDYRRLITLARLATEHSNTPSGKRATKLIADTLAAFELGDRTPRSAETYSRLRYRLDAAIDSLR